MNLDKMRRQLARSTPCGARYQHGPQHPVEVCHLPSTHVTPHDWPSLPTDPRQARMARGASALRLAGVSIRQAAANAKIR